MALPPLSPAKEALLNLKEVRIRFENGEVIVTPAFSAQRGAVVQAAHLAQTAVTVGEALSKLFKLLVKRGNLQL